MIGSFIKDRLQLGVGWLNIGQPVVSYYTPSEVVDFVCRSELGEIESSRTVHSRNLAGFIPPSLTFIVVRRVDAVGFVGAEH